MVVATVALGGPATRQAQTVAPSGFLGADASSLAKGQDDQPKLFYLDQVVSWKSFGCRSARSGDDLAKSGK